MKQRLFSSLLALIVCTTAAAQAEFEFQHFNEASVGIFNGNNFKSVAVGRFGKIWAGSQYHGIVKYDPILNSWGTSLDLRNVLITDIKRGNDEDVWISHSGQSGTQGGGSNIAGGINRFKGYGSMLSEAFYSITAPGGLTSRNARSIWIDEKRFSGGKYRVWVAQGTYITSNATAAGGISVGLNSTPNHFTKIYKGLQVTPNVPAAQAGLPNCISIGGNGTEVWVCALANFGRSQILRYRADDPNTFIGFYDYTNTPSLAAGFRANAIFFDAQGRAWLGLQEGGLRIQTSEGWKSMNDASVLPAFTNINANAICQDERGYIYFGTSAGVLIYKGGPVELASSYQRVTVSDGLPVNTINGVAADTLNNRIILAHTAGISFMKFKKKINFTLEWDHSFPKITIKPLGVAADGTSRLIVKVRRGDSVTMPIKKIGLAIKSVGSTISTAMGKLKVASVINSYSNEANTGTSLEVERTDSTASGDFNFWYVAPEDFSADSTGPFALLAERMDSIRVKILYGDDSEDSSFIPIKVVRPPLMITSMITGAKDMMDELKLPDGVPILKSNRFLSKIGVAMKQVSSIAENAARLIDGDQAQNDDRKNSYQGLLENMRAVGIAANRIDVVSHDFSGVAVRASMALKSSKFFADGDHSHNNYGRGFINKFITINVPHNGSLLFQAMKDFTPHMSDIGHKIGKIADQVVHAMEPYQLYEKTTDSKLKLVGALVAKGLTEASAYKLPETPVKNHLIGTELGEEGFHSGRGFSIDLQELRKHAELVALTARDQSPVLKPGLTASLADNIPSGEKIRIFLDNYAASKGQQNFTTLGDLFSNILSQTAGLPANAPNVTKYTYSTDNSVGHITTGFTAIKKVANLLNSQIGSSLFGNTIPANNLSTAATLIANKAAALTYDTAKIIITNRNELSPEGFRYITTGNTSENITGNDTTVTLRYTVKDTARLQYVFVNFQDTLYTTTSRLRNQQMQLTVKKSMLRSGLQELTAVAVYETADSIKYHADTLNRFVNKPDTLKGFRIVETSADAFDGIPYFPAYEVKINNDWERLSANDADLSFTIENPAKATYDNAVLGFSATADGYTRIYFQYKTYRDTVELNCLLPQNVIATNRSVVTGNFKDSATWSKGRPPLPGDSVIISAGHDIILDTTLQIRSLKIEAGGTLLLNNNTLSLTLGDAEDGDFMIDNYGSLNISNGTLKVSGRVKLNAGAAFNMTGGILIIDGNTGSAINSMQNGLFLFEAAAGMQAFSFTGGTLQLVDPPIGLASQAISCPYNFGALSTLVLGNGISVTAGNNPDGFGGNGFPPQIGKLVLDASAPGSNRLLNITKPLSVKGRFEVRNGSSLNMQAPVTVSP